jgi:hypothetical protein
MPKPKAKSPRRVITPPSPAELERRRAERERRRTERLASARPLLYPRELTAAVLHCSVSTVIRLEKEGRLRTVRLRGETGQVHHPVADVEALAYGEGGQADA